MKTKTFENLIEAVTGRKLLIDTESEDILNDTEYIVYRILPLTKIKVSFKWKAAKTDEKMLRSFITAFTSKYREPNPLSYDYEYGGKQYFWKDKTDEEKEYAVFHHVSHMYSKEKLLQQVQENFSNPQIEKSLIRYGFYTTEYGIGIFAFWETEYVVNAINKLKEFLSGKNIPFSNEYSDARWVYRFKLNISKDAHNNLLQSFN